MHGIVTNVSPTFFADSIVVELSRGESQSTAGSLQSLCWSSASAGGILSAYFSGSLVQTYGPQFVFLLTAAFPLLVAGAAISIPEKRFVTPPASEKSKVTGSTNYLLDDFVDTGNNRGEGGFLLSIQHRLFAALRRSMNAGSSLDSSVVSSMKTQVRMLWDAISQKSILLPTIFVFCWQATPTPDTAMLFFETNKLGFTTEFLGRIRCVTKCSYINICVCVCVRVLL